MRDNVYVRDVDVNRPGQGRIDFGSPVARQYHLQALPSFRIYAPSGKLLAQGAGDNDKLVGLLQKLFDPPKKASASPSPRASASPSPSAPRH